MDKRLKSLTRAICRIYGSAKPYKSCYDKISQLCRNPRIEKIKESNGFGTTLWLLGVYRTEWPKFVSASTMNEFLYENCSPCGKENGLIVAFRAPIDFDTDLEHTALYVSRQQETETHIIHQEDYKSPFVITTLEEFSEKNKNLKPEFYLPENLVFRV